MKALAEGLVLSLFLALILFSQTFCTNNHPKKPEGSDSSPRPVSNPAITSETAQDQRPATPEKARSCVNINEATQEELMSLPGIGKVLAARIIDYREKHGPFRRTEELIIIDGISERKYMTLAQLVCV